MFCSFLCVAFIEFLPNAGKQSPTTGIVSNPSGAQLFVNLSTASGFVSGNRGILSDEDEDIRYRRGSLIPMPKPNG